jgi:hypothetical protein
MTKEYIFTNYYSHFDRITGKTHYFKYGNKVFLRESIINGNKYYFFDFISTGIERSDNFFKFTIIIDEFIKLRNEKIEKIIQREE